MIVKAERERVQYFLFMPPKAKPIRVAVPEAGEHLEVTGHLEVPR